MNGNSTNYHKEHYPENMDWLEFSLVPKALLSLLGVIRSSVFVVRHCYSITLVLLADFEIALFSFHRVCLDDRAVLEVVLVLEYQFVCGKFNNLPIDGVIPGVVPCESVIAARVLDRRFYYLKRRHRVAATLAMFHHRDGILVDVK